MCIHVSLCVWCNARRTVQVVPGIFCSIIFSPPDGRSTTKGTYVESRLEIIQLCSLKPFVCLGRTIHIAFIVDAADMHIVGIRVLLNVLVYMQPQSFVWGMLSQKNTIRRRNKSRAILKLVWISCLQ